jgi:hypothetical protein
MATKNIKLDKQVIGETLVADSNSESGVEASEVEDEFDELQRRKRKNNKNKTCLSTRKRARNYKKWRSTKLEAASRNEQQYPPF